MFILSWIFFYIASVRGIHPQSKGFLVGAGHDEVQTSVAPLGSCNVHWFRVPLDHFNFVEDKQFSVRYFTCLTDRWARALFVYFGNEADVTLYLNNTGLMWESAGQHGASLVFLEHRYYGESKPFAKLDKNTMGYLSTSQAMADYAAILTHLKKTMGRDDLPIIGFGGSYGGMIATYFRLKYPYLVDGVIAASAPIWSYFGEGYDRNSFAKVVTRDAHMASSTCVENARKAWKVIFSLGNTPQGRRLLSNVIGICSIDTLQTYRDVENLVDWMSEAWDYMAMGNFPYESSYLVDGIGRLPAYPVNKACSFLKRQEDGIELVSSMAKAIGVYYNSTKIVPCYQYNTGSLSETENFWSYQYCTEHFMPMERDGVNDMFYRQPFNTSRAIQDCRDAWGVEPDMYRGITEYGGRSILHYISNAVFSNGALDPWSGGGVLEIPAWLEKKNNLRTIMISEGAHHVDLMFSNQEDPMSFKEARRIENEMIGKWIQEKKARQGIVSNEPRNLHMVQ